MRIARQALLLALACGGAAAHAGESGCAVPQFPACASGECVHRVDAQVREWRLCLAAYHARPEEAAMLRVDQEVEARLANWLVATRVSADGQAERQRQLNRIDRERRLYLDEQAASGRIVYAVERK